MSGQGASINLGQVDGIDPTINITITVTDGSGRCPSEYQAANPFVANQTDGWDSPNNIYYKYITP